MSHVAPSVAQEDDAKSTAWRYAVAGARDLRIDFMRGIALVMMVVAHTEVMSVFNIFSWKRFGLTTGAEGFVILSGFMLGMLNRARLQKVVLLTVSWGLYLRAWKIYRVNIIILGLYIFLLLLSPLFLGMLQKGKVWWLLGLSLLVYSLWQRWPLRLTPSEFEFAFPLLAWQFIFVLGMASGWYKAELLSFARTPPGKGVVVALVMVSLVLGFVAQNHTNPFMPPALLMHVIPPDSFNSFYHTWAAKNGLGPVRVLNDIALMVTVYLVLTYCWTPLNRLLGWFLIPLGQHSLYTFILHVYVVLLVSQFITFDLWRHAWIENTLVHAAALGILWLMAKYDVGARWIPN